MRTHRYIFQSDPAAVKIRNGDFGDILILLEMGGFYRADALSEKTETIYRFRRAEAFCRSEFGYRLGRNVCDVAAVADTGYFNLFIPSEVYRGRYQYNGTERMSGEKWSLTYQKGLSGKGIKPGLT